MKTYYLVLRRLRLMDQRQARWEIYEEFDTYEQAHACMMDRVELAKKSWYLPHHYVVQPVELPVFPDEPPTPIVQPEPVRKPWWARLFVGKS